MALQRGFTTKISLGMGYTIMLDLTDRLLLATSEQGTTVILLKHLREAPEDLSLQQLGDEWDRL